MARRKQSTGGKLPKRIRRYAGIHRAWHQIRAIQLSVRQLRLAGFQQAVRVAQASALDSSRSVWISGFTGPELVVHTLTFGGNSITSGRDIYRVDVDLWRRHSWSWHDF